jgi:hypothetical protein
MMKMQFYFCRGAACLRPQTVKTGKGRITIRPYKKTHRNYAWLILTGLGIVFFMSVPVNATVIQAASCSQQDVQTAINAAGDGDTVRVPAGNCTWTTLTAHTPVVTINQKAIILRGSGNKDTVITANTGNSWGEQALKVYSIGGKPFRITNFKFIAGNGTFLNVVGTGKDWRIDHCEFNSSVLNGTIIIGDVNVGNYLNGVIDNCTFNNSNIVILFGDGHFSWKQPLDLGSSDAIYIEDCQFVWNIFGNSLDCNSGAKYVARYNTFVNTYVSTHSLMNATGPNTFSRGTRCVEVYNNTFTSINTTPPTYNWVALQSRAGTGVFFGNRIINSTGDIYDIASGIDNTRSFETFPYIGSCDGGNPLDGNTPLTLLWDGNDGTGSHTGANGAVLLTDTTKNWNASKLIGNYVYNLTDGSKGQISSATITTVTCTLSGGSRNNWNAGDAYKITNGYPCLDQIGRSTDYGAGINRLPQALEPFYAWDNKRDGVLEGLTVLNNCGHHIKDGRDYINSTSPKPGYTAYAYPHPFRVTGPLADVNSQTITLASGWNWISFNVLPNDLSFNSALADILSQVEQVKAQPQSAIYSGGNWKGDLANMNGIGQCKMFKVKVNATCTLTVLGTAVLSTNPIPLGGGGNWVAYLPTTAMPIATALDSIKDQVQEVKSLTQSATFNGTTWSGMLTQLAPGQGYAIKMSAPGILTYPATSMLSNPQGKNQ